MQMVQISTAAENVLSRGVVFSHSTVILAIDGVNHSLKMVLPIDLPHSEVKTVG